MYEEWPDTLGDGTVLWTRRTAPGPAPAPGPGPAPGSAPASGHVPASGFVPRPTPPEHRILPDGCLDIIWLDGELLVAGPDTRAHVGPDRPDSVAVGVRFRRGHGPAVLGVPGHELRDARVPLDALWPAREARNLAERVSAATDRPAALADVVRPLLRRTPPDPLTVAVWRRLRAGRPVAETAEAVGLSSRQLQRRSLTAFGYGPKTLARILRFDRALHLARTGAPLAAVAATAGYADQAHLAREVRSLAGVPLTTLLPSPSSSI